MEETLIEYQKNMALKRRVQQQAFAIIQRAKNAGMPETEMRIKEKQFFEMLDLEFYKEHGMSKEKVIEMCHELYTIPARLLNVHFAIIDGGDSYLRKRAGFALLFRGIAWDKVGMHNSFGNASHRLQSIRSLGEGEMTRNEFANDLKEYDILFLSEYNNSLFVKGFDTGSFADEILEDREINGKITIISFQNALAVKGYENQNNSASDMSKGQYISMFFETDYDDSLWKISDQEKLEEKSKKIRKRFLRIRVGKNG